MRYTTILLTLMGITTLASYAQPTTNAPDPTQVRQMIGREKVVTFSKDYLIKDGLKPEDLTSWEATIKKARSFVKPTHHEPLLTNSDRLFYILDNANAFAKEAIKNLNAIFGSHYEKQAGKYVPTHLETITSKQHINLKTINEKAQEYKKKVLAVANAAFPRSFIDAQPAPNSWVNLYIKNKRPEELFPGYNTFLNDYLKSNNYTTFKTSFGAKYDMATKNEKAFENILNKIEYVIHVLRSRKTAFFEKKNIELLRAIAKEIRTEFPTILSSLDFYKMAKTTSMQRTVLSAYAEAMEGVLNQIIRETNTLLVTMKK